MGAHGVERARRRRAPAAAVLASALVATGVAGVAVALSSASREPAPVWAAEFEGPAGSGSLARDWTAMTGAGWGVEELQAYTSHERNVALDGQGHLRITVRREPTTDAAGRSAEYTSARLHSAQAHEVTRLEARIRVPAGQGLWPAFWTLGADVEEVGWPASGEVDVMEVVDDADRLMVNAHAASDGSQGRWQDLALVDVDVPLSRGWHVYAVEWTDEGLVFSLDGEVVHEVLRAERAPGEQWPFDGPQTVILNVAVKDTREVMTGGLGPPAPDTPLPAEMLVDWVRAYR